MSLSQQQFLLRQQSITNEASTSVFDQSASFTRQSALLYAARTPSEFMVRYQQWYFSYYGEQLKVPRFNKNDLDLEQLWTAVMIRGGSAQVSNKKQWAEIGRLFDPPASMTNLSFHIKRLYEKYLLAFEKAVSPSTAMEWRYAPVSKQPSHEPSMVASSLHEGSGASVSPRSPPHKKQAQKQQGPVVDRLVGSVIRIYLPDKGDYCTAIVTGYDSQLWVHTVRLQDGSIRDVKLADCVWQEIMSSGKLSSENQNVQNISSALGSQVRQFLLSNSVSFDTAPVDFGPPRIVNFDKEGEKLESESKLVCQDENKTNVVSSQFSPQEEKGPSQAASFAPLVYKLQTQLQTALQKVKQLESREEQRAQEIQQMHASFLNKERQFREMVTELRSQLREAIEGKQTAEGAVHELRNCFSLLVSNQGLPTSLFP